MASLTRAAPKNSAPGYKDYVNFLGHYKNGKKEELDEPNPVKKPNGNNFSNYLDKYQNNNKEETFHITRSLSNSTNTSSNSSISSDVPDFPKNTCIPYNTYLENSKNKKFNPVKPAVEEKTTKRSEIFIEIQPAKSVSEVSKVFEPKPERTSPKLNKINSKISIFEKQISTESKPKLAEKPVLASRPSLPKALTPPPKAVSPIPVFETENKASMPPPPKTEASGSRNGFMASRPTPPKAVTPPPKAASPIPVFEPENKASTPPPPKTEAAGSQNGFMPPPPPPPPPMDMQINKIATPTTNLQNTRTPPLTTNGGKMQATLTKGPQTVYSVNNAKGINPNEIDRNDPMVRKLVYGTLRGLYGAYHNKANDFVATLPRNMVVKNNGVQEIIDKIALNGDLDKLTGRVNPKSDQE